MTMCSSHHRQALASECKWFLTAGSVLYFETFHNLNLISWVIGIQRRKTLLNYHLRVPHYSFRTITKDFHPIPLHYHANKKCLRPDLPRETFQVFQLRVVTETSDSLLHPTVDYQSLTVIKHRDLAPKSSFYLRVSRNLIRLVNRVRDKSGTT